MSYSLTSEERQIAINQITLLDRFCFEGPGSCHVVPIPPKRHGEPERWVAVDTSTGSYQFQTNILQPDPERAVLCTHCRYCYGDKFSCYIISSIVSTVIFSAITTPLLLLCCIPMMINLVKVCFKQLSVYSYQGFCHIRED